MINCLFGLIISNQLSSSKLKPKIFELRIPQLKSLIPTPVELALAYLLSEIFLEYSYSFMSFGEPKTSIG
jgi:uncharacterized protein YacL